MIAGVLATTANSGSPGLCESGVSTVISGTGVENFGVGTGAGKTSSEEFCSLASLRRWRYDCLSGSF